MEMISADLIEFIISYSAFSNERLNALGAGGRIIRFNNLQIDHLSKQQGSLPDKLRGSAVGSGLLQPEETLATFFAKLRYRKIVDAVYDSICGSCGSTAPQAHLLVWHVRCTSKLTFSDAYLTRLLMADPSRISSVAIRTTISPAFKSPSTSISSPSTAPFLTSTHCARPF